MRLPVKSRVINYAKVLYLLALRDVDVCDSDRTLNFFFLEIIIEWQLLVPIVTFYFAKLLSTVGG
jgi:hypothetical protein